MSSRRVFTFFFVVAFGVGAARGQGTSGQERVNAAQQTAPRQPPASEQSPSAPKSQQYTLNFIENSKAVYPPAAKEKKIQGLVVGMISVSESGSVENVDFYKGDPLLTASAEEAAKKWKFQPVLKDGKPVRVVARAAFNFVLADEIQDTKDVAAELDQVSTFPQRVRVSQGVSTGLLVRKVNPNYPPEARQARIQGTVVLRAVISKEGSVEGLTLVSGHPLLARAAIDAAKQWRYRPYLFLGNPVEVDTEILMNFQLR